MSLIPCPTCKHQVFEAAACCPQCAHPIRNAAPTSRPPAVVVARDYDQQQTVDGIADLLEALSIVTPAIVFAGPLYWLTQQPLVALIGGGVGLAGAFFINPFRRYVNSRCLFTKVLAAGIAGLAAFAAMRSILG